MNIYQTVTAGPSDDWRQPCWVWSYAAETWDLLIDLKVRLFMNSATAGNLK